MQYYLGVNELAFNSETIDLGSFDSNQYRPGNGDLCLVRLVADLSL